MDKVKDRLRRLWWVVPMAVGLGSVITFGLGQVGAPEHSVTGFVNTRLAADLPTDRIDLIQDLNAAVAQQPVLDQATETEDSVVLSPGDVNVSRVGASSVARVSLAWSGDRAQGESLLKAAVAAATKYVLGDAVRSQLAEQLENARADAVAADTEVTRALAGNNGLNPQNQLVSMQRSIAAGTFTGGRTDILHVLRRAEKFARIERNARLAAEALSAVNQLEAEDQVSTTRTAKSLGVQLEPASVSSSGSTAVRRVIAGGLLGGLIALVLLTATAFRSGHEPRPHDLGKRSGS